MTIFTGQTQVFNDSAKIRRLTRATATEARYLRAAERFQARAWRLWIAAAGLPFERCTEAAAKWDRLHATASRANQLALNLRHRIACHLRDSGRRGVVLDGIVYLDADLRLEAPALASAPRCGFGRWVAERKRARAVRRRIDRDLCRGADLATLAQRYAADLTPSVN